MEKEILSQYELVSLRIFGNENYQVFKINKVTGQIWSISRESNGWIEEEVKPATSKE